MTIRFVYPTYDALHRPALRIQRECEDGQIWFGVEGAIQNYCEENGLDIKDVEWKIDTDLNSYSVNSYENIIAKDIKDWKNQFEQLSIKWG